MSDSSQSGPAPALPWTPEALAERLAGELQGLEGERLRILAKRKAGYTKLLLAGVGCAFAGMAGSMLLPPWGMAFGIVPFAIAAVVIHGKYFGKDREAYEHEYKRRVVGGMTSALEPGMAYHPERGLPETWFRSSGLYKGDIDRYSCEDLFEGRIGKTSLWLSEVHAEDKRTRTNSKGHSETYWVTIFEGLLVVADFHKHFQSEVVVMPDFAEATFGWFGRAVQKLGGNLELMESPEFEKAFVVRASDPIEARYILTPDLQERMLSLRQRMGKEVRFAFRDSHLFLTIPKSEDWFEPHLKHPAHDQAQMRTFLSQMAACFRVVEDLNLNTRIWTKE